MKTLYQLYKDYNIQPEEPFINAYGGSIFVCVVDKEGILFSNLLNNYLSSGELHHNGAKISNYIYTSLYEMIDYIDHSGQNTTNNQNCICDFYNVILIKGCQCGGK